MSAGEEFTRLLEIMHRLRAECPWDRSQDHDTLRAYLLEEAYEVLHVLDERRYTDLCEELGDLMLQVVFHAEIAEEDGRFAIEDVLRGINEKLVRRHPHVFADAQAHSPADVLRRWERIKRDEGKMRSALDGVPAELPALLKATRMLSKIRQTGVDPFRGRDVVADAGRWLDGLTRAVAAHDAAGAMRATGLLSLAVAEIAERVRVSPEDALRETLRRLKDAFWAHEARLTQEGRAMTKLAEDELAAIAVQIMAECEGDPSAASPADGPS